MPPFAPHSTELDNALRPLYERSLINRIENQKTFTFDKLLRDVMIEELYTNEQKGEYKQCAIQTVSAAFFQELRLAEEDQIALYLPHVAKCIEYIKELADQEHDISISVKMAIIQLLHDTGRYLLQHPQYEDESYLRAEPLLTDALRIREQLTADDTAYPALATCLHSVAEFYYQRFQYKDAPKIETATRYSNEALSLLSKRTPPITAQDNIDMATIHSDLGKLYYIAGKYVLAKDQFNKGLERCNLLLESSTTDLDKIELLLDKAMLVNNIALCRVHDSNGDKGDAYEKICKEAKEALEEGKELLDRQTSSSGKEAYQVKWRDCQLQYELGKAAFIVYQEKVGRYEEAKNIYQGAIKTDKEAVEAAEKVRRPVSGGVYIGLVTRLNNLAELARIRRLYKEAAKHYEEALRCYQKYYQIYAQTPEKNHPIVYTVWENAHALPRNVINEKNGDRYASYDKRLGITRMLDRFKVTSVTDG